MLDISMYIGLIKMSTQSQFSVLVTVLPSPLDMQSSGEGIYRFAFGAQEPPAREETEILGVKVREVCWRKSE